MLTALFGINDGSLNLAVNLLILVLVVVWIALVWWTYADARRRIDDSVLVTTATAASLFPFIGTIVYTILRPPEFLADARERELETQASELRLRRLTETSCPRCEHPVELSWLRCPECQHRLKDPCRSCGRPVDPRWAICPHCETAVAESSAPSRDESRRQQRQAQPKQARSRPSSARPSGERRTKTKPQPKRRTSSSSEAGSRKKTSADRSERAQRSEESSDKTDRPRRKPSNRT